MKTLIIAEKPDMGRNIAAAIEPKAQNRRTYLEGERYLITWAIGHLVSLAEPDQYDDRYKKWSFEDLPIIPDSFKLIPNPRTRDQLKVIAELAKRCGRLVNACDAGREGQLIFSYIQQYLSLTHPVQRLWISDLTPETIRQGFAQLKNAVEYDNLTRAAIARSEADWLVGMNSSRAFTTKHNVLLSGGRVQTPVLALIHDREKLIEAFTSLKYFEVEASFVQQSASYKGTWQGERITDAKAAEALAAKVKGKPAVIKQYDVKDSKEYPHKLYDLTLLQRDANAKFGLSAKKTLDIAQALYEKHKVISYPRTNSNYVNEQNIPEMHKALQALSGNPSYEDMVRGADRSLVHKNNKGICNPAKVEDHHAILPTAKRPGKLSPDEEKLYDLIIRRFLSQFYRPAEYKLHTVMTAVEGELFKTSLKQLVDLGWKVLYADLDKDGGAGRKSRKRKEEEDAEQAPEEIQEAFHVEPAEQTRCKDVKVKEKDTQPPKPYTEGTLLKAMESAGKQIEDEELRDAMKDAGLGTPATRAATIERLKAVGYIELKGKTIRITQKGRSAIAVIRGAGIELLTSPEMTGHWERRLNEIAKGQASDEAFIDNVKKFTRSIVEKVRVQPRTAREEFGAADSETRSRRGSAKSGSRKGPAKAQSSSAAAAAERPPRTAGKSAGKAAAEPAELAGRSVGRTASESATGAASEPVGAASSEPAGASAADVRKPLGPCPRPGCTGQIIIGNRGYGCTSYKTGCRFVIWKNSMGAVVTVPMLRALITGGATGKLSLRTEDGEPYEARLALKDRSTGELGVQREL